MPYNSEYFRPTQDPSVPCRHCKTPGGVVFKVWESDCGGYEDTHYKCTNCHKEWWIDGPDA